MSSFSTGLYGSTIGSIVNDVNGAFSGKTSGIDVNTVVGELMQLQRQPEVLLQNQQSTITSQISALNGIGTQLSALYDSVNNLRDLVGVFSQKTTGSSDAAIVSASADSTAASGTHTIIVSKLATVSSSYSDYLPSGTSLAGSEIAIKYGSDPDHPLKTDTIDIPADATSLQKAADDINKGNYGVTANVITDSQGSRLVFVSKTSGAAGNLTVTSAAAPFTNSAGVDAQITVDGVPYSNGTNTITGAISGVTLSIGAADPDTPVLVSVEPDSTAASQAIQDFVTSYNAVMGSINSEFAVNSTTGSSGVLAGDTMLRTLQSQLLGMAANSGGGNGRYVNLQSMGIEMQNDGTLTVNSKNLSDALSNHYTDVQSFFQSTAGWGQAAGAQMLKLMDPVLGPVGADINGLKQTNQSLANQVSDFEVRMQTVQAQLTSRYSALNALLQRYPSLIQQTAAQLGSLPDLTSGSKG